METAPKFELVIGMISGEQIVLVDSKTSCFADVPAEFKAGCRHLIANPKREMTRQEAYAKGITPEKVQALLRNELGHIKPEIIKYAFPELVHEQFGMRTETNDLVTATVDSVHVHVLIALAQYWKAKMFRRCVQSLMNTEWMQPKEPQMQQADEVTNAGLAHQAKTTTAGGFQAV